MKVTNQKRNGIILCLFLLCVCGYYLIIADTPMKGDADVSQSDAPKIVKYSEKGTEVVQWRRKQKQLRFWCMLRGL